VESPAIRRTEFLISGARGDHLFSREWLPPDPERVLLLVHGLAEHSGRYEHVGAWFAERACAVHAYDQRGHGKSAGVPGHLRRFSDYLDDLEAVLRRVRERHPELPVFLVGHSMGGLVVTTFARERRPEVAGIVTSGAALRVPANVSRTTLAGARLLARLLPRLRMNPQIDPAGLSRVPEVVRAYVDDPLVFSRITASFASELFAAMRRTGDGGADVRVPTLLLHGEADLLCPVEASRHFFAQLGAGEKGLRTYPGLFHEIFNEPERERVFDDLLAWLRGLATDLPE
jgi:alpha-beta hydrolase superfamily lysophospholipase